MSNDDLTRKMPADDEADKETQPTITAVFRLLQDLESRLNARLDKTDARLDAIESRLALDIEGLNTRVTEVNTRVTELNTRVTELNTRVTELNTRVTELNTRVTEGFKDIGHKINALNRRGLQQEADYEDLFERIGRLESKAS